MASLFNLVAMTVSSAFGTSTTIPLGSAATISGVTYLSFALSGASGGTSVDYSILDTGNSEIGTATYTSSNVTLTSRTPTKSTNGGAAIAATSAAVILCSPRAETLGTVQSVGTGNSSQTGLTGGPITISGALAVSLSVVANSISSDVALTVTSSYKDGPSCAQGSTGVWLATGQVTLIDTAQAAPFAAKLWDGTTVIDSGSINTTVAGGRGTIGLSGAITNPASNIRISVTDNAGAPAGLIKANDTGNSKDSTLTVIRIG
jgi:hypothetical protein